MRIEIMNQNGELLAELVTDSGLVPHIGDSMEIPDVSQGAHNVHFAIVRERKFFYGQEPTVLAKVQLVCETK